MVSILEPVKAPSALTTVIIPHLEPEGTKELDKDGTGKNGKKTWFYSTVFYEINNFLQVHRGSWNLSAHLTPQ